MAWLSVSLLITLLSTVASGRNSCIGYYNDTALNCYGIVLESDKPLQIDRKMYRYDTGLCSDTDCLNYVFPELYIGRSSGSIGRETFSAMPEIEYLVIHESKIDHIDDGAICSIPNLKKFTLVDNLVFPSLTESMFSNCSKLRDFKYYSSIPLEATVLQQIIGLESLTISSQNFSKFTKEYLKPLTMLKEFQLEYSSIGDIEEGALCVSPNLEVLSFSRSVLPTLTKSEFSNCQNVKHLQLPYCENLNIEEHAFGDFVNIEFAYFHKLQITRLKKAFVSGLENVEHFEIFDSDISTIDGDCFSNFDKLSEMTLSGLKLTEIDPEVLTHLPKLLRLNLGNNKLTSIANVTHPVLEYLWVYDNKITDINPETLKANLPKLKDIQIHGNPISPEKVQDLVNQLSPSIKVNGL